MPSPVVKKSLLLQGREAEAVPEVGVEVADKEGPLKPAQMGPQHQLLKTGALDTLTTLQMGAADHIGNGGRTHTIAVTEPFAPGVTELCLDPHNRNSNRNRKNNQPV